MSFLLLCLLFISLGYIIGKKVTIDKVLTNRVSTAILFIMLASLGYKVGSNKEILSNLSTLGIQALVICIATVLGSVLFVFLYLLRRKTRDN